MSLLSRVATQVAPEVRRRGERYALDGRVRLVSGNEESARAVVRGSGGGFNTVTLEATAAEAELLVFSQSMKGRLYLTLRNRSDASYLTDLPQVNFEMVEKRIPELNRFRQQVIRQKGSN